jgi:hypothetical protein
MTSICGSPEGCRLARLGELYRPRPGRQTKPVTLVLDNGPIPNLRIAA